VRHDHTIPIPEIGNFLIPGIAGYPIFGTILADAFSVPGIGLKSVFGINTSGDNEKIKHIAEDCLYIAKILEMLLQCLSIISLQLFAYYVDVLHGL